MGDKIHFKAIMFSILHCFSKRRYTNQVEPSLTKRILVYTLTLMYLYYIFHQYSSVASHIY